MDGFFQGGWLPDLFGPTLLSGHLQESIAPRPHPGKPKGLGQWAPCNDYTVSNMNLELGASMLAPTCTRYSHIMSVANVLASICMEFHLI